MQPRPATLEPLSEAELSSLESILSKSKPGGAMNVEELDGFFAALLVGPPVEKPCHYWPVVLGKNAGDPGTLEVIRSTMVLLPLLARHWDGIAQTLNRGDVHLPYLSTDCGAVPGGRDWSRGFLRGIEQRLECWQPLIADDAYAAAVLPMMILAHDGDPDPSLRPPPILAQERHDLILQVAAGLIRARRYFAKFATPVAAARSAHLH